MLLPLIFTISAALVHADNVMHLKAPEVKAAPSPASNIEDISIDTAPGAYTPSGTLPPEMTASLPSDALVFETAASGDVLIALSPSVQKDLTKTMKANCGGAPDTQCQEAVHDVLQRQSVNIEKRVVCGGVCACALLALASSVIIQMYETSQSGLHIEKVQLPSKDVAQATPYDTATNLPTGVVLEYGSTTVTANLPARPTTATGPVPDVSFLTLASAPHAAGDAVITMPSPLALKVQQILDDSPCDSQPKQKRQVDASCLLSGATNLMNNAYAGGPIHDLLLMPHNVPLLRDQDILRVVGQIIALARLNAAKLAITTEQAANVGAVLVYLAAQVIVNHQRIEQSIWYSASDLTIGSVPTQDISLPASVSASATASSTTSSGKCPGPSDPALICQEPYCSGDTKASRCSALGTLNNCACTNAGNLGPTFKGFFDRSFDGQQQSILGSMSSALAQTTPPPDCGVNSAEPKFDGGPGASPISWCYCSQSYYPFANLQPSNGTYEILQTATAGASNPQCGYSTMPTSTISVVYPSQDATLTSCKLVTTTLSSLASGVTNLKTDAPYSYCTCNKDGMQGVSSTTFNGQETKFCPDKKPTPPPATTEPPAFNCPTGGQEWRNIACSTACPGGNYDGCDHPTEHVCTCNDPPCAGDSCWKGS